MNLATRLRQALDPIPSGSLVPVDFVREIVEDCGGDQDTVDFTVQDVATMLDRAPSTVRTWAGQGKLPGAYRLHGREWRIPRSALRALRDGDEHTEPTRSRNGRVDLGSWRKVSR